MIHPASIASKGFERPSLLLGNDDALIAIDEIITPVPGGYAQVSFAGLLEKVQALREDHALDSTYLYFPTPNQDPQPVLSDAHDLPEPFTFFDGQAEINPAELTLHYLGEPIALTHREYRLVSYLGSIPGVVRTRAQILEHAWDNYDGMYNHTVDVHITRLRKKTHKDIIRTKQMVGYFAPK